MLKNNLLIFQIINFDSVLRLLNLLLEPLLANPQNKNPHYSNIERNNQIMIDSDN